MDFIEFFYPIILFILIVGLLIIIKSCISFNKSMKFNNIKGDVLLIRNYKYFTYDMLYAAIVNIQKDYYYPLLHHCIRVTKTSKTRRINPFKKLTDHEKLLLIDMNYNRNFIDIITEGFGQKPSDYLKKELNRMKLEKGLPKHYDCHKGRFNLT